MKGKWVSYLALVVRRQHTCKNSRVNIQGQTDSGTSACTIVSSAEQLFVTVSAPVQYDAHFIGSNQQGFQLRTARDARANETCGCPGPSFKTVQVRVRRPAHQPPPFRAISFVLAEALLERARPRGRVGGKEVVLAPSVLRRNRFRGQRPSRRWRSAVFWFLSRSRNRFRRQD